MALADVRFHGALPMREVVVTGRKPGCRPKKLTHVTDDFGDVFRRGERVSLNVDDWQALSKDAAAEQGQFFEVS